MPDNLTLQKQNQSYGYKHRNGLGHVGSYQVSGHPFITGSATVNNNTQLKVEFPSVARSVTVVNRADVALFVYFNDASAFTSANAVDSGHTENVLAGQHYITLDSTKDSVTFEVKCKEIYIGNKDADGGAFQLWAELTGIPSTDMYALSGSGLTDVDGTHGSHTTNNHGQTTI
jgi:hypothetical protein